MIKQHQMSVKIKINISDNSGELTATTTTTAIKKERKQQRAHTQCFGVVFWRMIVDKRNNNKTERKKTKKNCVERMHFAVFYFPPLLFFG